MVKRTAPRRYYDERTFAVTVRFVNPFDGSRFQEREAWLKARVGGEYETYVGGTVNGKQCSLLMINDLEVALAYVQHFDLKVAGLPRYLL